MRGCSRFAWALVAVVLAACAEGEAPPPEAAELAGPKTALTEVRTYERAERVTRLYGAPMATSESPRASAEAVRLERAAVLGAEAGDLVLEAAAAPFGAAAAAGVGDGAQGLMYDRATGKYRFSLYRYRQEREGVRVYDASLRVVVRNEPPYPAVLAVSALRDVRGFTPRRMQGVVDRAKANAAVRASRERTDFTGRALAAVDPQLARFGAPEAVIWAGVEDDRASPRVAVTYVADNYESPGAPRPEKWRFVADAETGEILHAESLIRFDVGGNVSGRVTSSAREMRCDPEAVTPFPHADVRVVSGNAATTDADGDFVIAHGGVSMVTVESPVTGKHFEVFDFVSARDEVLQAMVLPPGPATFIHNAVGVTTEFLTAQANAYANANEARDWVLSYHPTYPDVAGQVRFPVIVNRTDDICPGNAWYDNSSLSFCQSFDHPSPLQQDFGNTSFASVAQHEFGHHLVEVAGSGQDEYGEGMSDVIAMLISGSSSLGLGFFLDECTVALRDANNTCQYDAVNCSDCGSEIHDCGNLLAGAVWDLREALLASDPGNAVDIVSNLAVNSILLHTGTAIDPQITIDFLTLDDDDDNLDNGTPHRTQICSAFGAHGLGCPPLPTGMTVSPTADFASSGPLGGPFAPASKVYTVENLTGAPLDYEVTSATTWLTLTNATGTLAGGATADVTVQVNAGADVLPRGVHAATLAFTNLSGAGDTTRDVALEIGRSVVASWDLSTNPGWTAGTGWAFGVPSGGGGNIGDDNYGNPDPTSGATGSNVYGYDLSGNYANNLVERHLTSTVIDLSDMTHVVLKFKRWLCVEASIYDHAYVRVSTNGTTWTNVWENTHTINGGTWEEQEIDISGVANLQPTVRLRWTMGETDAGWRYCGWNLDDVEVSGIQIPACVVAQDCDDGLYCNGVEDCSAGTCVPGTAVACNDGIACTDDFCDEATDACDVTPEDSRCDNDVFCDGVEVCDEASGCGPGTTLTCDDGIACTLDNCSEISGCVNTPIHLDCDNGVYCDGTETCHNVLGCVAGLGNPCDDGVACTTNTCVEGTDSCSYPPNDGACGDGAFCNGVETCDVALGCQAGTAVGCSDGIACTTDTCNETTDGCDHAANHAACGDGTYCNGAETCDVVLGCQAGTAVNCGDGVTCTNDACNETTDGCDHVTNDAACGDGTYCNGAEVCDAVLGCQAGAAVDCSDGVSCTTDTCNEGTDGCDHVTDDAACVDALYCDGTETCHLTLGCQEGTPIDCDDGVSCTTDSCDESIDACDHLARDIVCDDGLFCDGAETCDALLDCQDEADPCVGMVCDEAGNACVTPVVDAGAPDTGSAMSDEDAGAVDAASPQDAATASDASVADSGTPDTGTVSTEPPAAGTGGVTAGGDAEVAQDGGDEGGGDDGGGCGCRAVGRPEQRSAGAWILVLLALGVGLGRRRSVRAHSVRRQ